MELTIEQALQQGVAAHKEGRLQDAEKLYTSILNAKPEHPDANHNLGVLAVGVGKPEQALPLLKKALEANPQVEQFWLSYIDALIKAGQTANALGVLKQGRDTGLKGERVDQLEAQLNADQAASGSIHPTQNQLDELITLYNQGRLEDVLVQGNILANQFSKNAVIQNILGAAYSGLGRSDEAIASYNKAIELKPDYAEAYSNVGFIYNSSKFFEKAAGFLKKAIVFSPSYGPSYFNFGIQSKGVEDIDLALKSYERALLLNPSDTNSNFKIGNIFLDFGNYTEAVSKYKKTLIVTPSFAESYNNLGKIFDGLNEPKYATKYSLRVLILNPNSAAAHNNLGFNLFTLGSYLKAIKHLSVGLALQPESSNTINNLGKAYNALGRHEVAVSFFKKAIEVEPNYTEAYNNLGSALDDSGKYQEAIAFYKRAILLQPKYHLANQNLGILLLVMCRYSEAAECFRQCDTQESKSFLLRCLYHLDEEGVFYEHLDALILEGQCNAIIGSLVSRADIKFGTSKPNLFCHDPMSYVLEADLKQSCDFENVFSKPVKQILSEDIIAKRQQDLLSNGIQTAGNLFASESSLTQDIQNILHAEIKKYRDMFKDSKEGFITNWPTEYSLHGWLISMKSGGELRPHMHEKGWLSGSIYINVPPKAASDSGNLVVCIDDKLADTEDKRPNKKSIDVSTGTLCFFPASLLHYTIPFTSEQERVVLAFDVIPKS